MSEFEMYKLPEWIVPIKELIISDKVADWCRMQYPGHPKGCPNYGKNSKCPPDAPHITEYFDINKQLYLVHSEFDLKSHAEMMKEKHPEWSDRQCRCLLYWQSRSRKQMKERAELAIKLLRTDRVTACPEAMGVNVFVTALLSGLKLDRTRNINISRHVTLIGFSKEK